MDTGACGAGGGGVDGYWGAGCEGEERHREGWEEEKGGVCVSARGVGGRVRGYFSVAFVFRFYHPSFCIQPCVVTVGRVVIL